MEQLPRSRRLATRHPPLKGLLGALLSGLLTQLLNASSLPTRLQSIELDRGWNAVWLEVDPLDPAPGSLFSDLPIDQVAHLFRPSSSVQFITDPDDESWNREAWGIWRPAGRDDSFLNSLHKILGNRSYLIHATAPVSWQVEGTPSLNHRSWKIGSLNLRGFGVDPDSPPTFADFFAGANGHLGRHIYHLDKGSWKKVLQPQIDRIRSGEAYWVHCAGSTEFHSPIGLQLPGTSPLVFSAYSTERSITLHNHHTHPSPITVESFPPGRGTELSLIAAKLDRSELTNVYHPVREHSLGELPPAASTTLKLRLDNTGTPDAPRSTLLRISNGHGAVRWVPVSAETR